MNEFLVEFFKKISRVNGAPPPYIPRFVLKDSESVHSIDIKCYTFTIFQHNDILICPFQLEYKVYGNNPIYTKFVA